MDNKQIPLNISDLISRIDYRSPFIYRAKFTLNTNNTTNDTQNIKIGGRDFLSTHFSVKGYDSDGDVLHLSTTGRDVWLLTIKDPDGQNLENAGIDVFSYNDAANYPQLNYRFWTAKCEYELVVQGDSFPATPKNTYPVHIHFEAHGYQLLGQ